MFTGIVEELGRVIAIKRGSGISLLEIEAVLVSTDAKIGDSIAVNGACLTVAAKDKLSFGVMPETLSKTNLGELKFGDKVNLERALKVGDRLSGHFVTGHIDCVGVVKDRRQEKNNTCFEIEVACGFMPLVVSKGSVCIDGISLTVVEKKPRGFTVYIIPHTLKSTTLGFRRHSSKVNVEFDILAKYLRSN